MFSSRWIYERLSWFTLFAMVKNNFCPSWLYPFFVLFYYSFSNFPTFFGWWCFANYLFVWKCFNTRICIHLLVNNSLLITCNPVSVNFVFPSRVFFNIHFINVIKKKSTVITTRRNEKERNWIWKITRNLISYFVKKLNKRTQNFKNE